MRLVPLRAPIEKVVGGYVWKFIVLNVLERDEIFENNIVVGDPIPGDPGGGRKVEQDTFKMLAELMCASIVEVPPELPGLFKEAYPNEEWELTPDKLRMLDTSLYTALSDIIRPLVFVQGDDENFLGKA